MSELALFHEFQYHPFRRHAYFGENCFWLFRRKEEWKIRDAYKICQGKQIRSVRYLMGVLRNI